jgi:ankyrin repeat protein
MGHTAVVKLLLSRQHIKADSKSKNGRTPLSWATGGGHVAVVELLLSRQDIHVNYKDENGKTPTTLGD